MSANPNFVVLDALPPEGKTSAASDIDLAPEQAQRDAYEWEEHVLEITTGYRSGTSDRALKGEPRSQYAPEIAA
ncbi:hypothetical protein, partial [Gordonia aichiensis]